MVANAFFSKHCKILLLALILDWKSMVVTDSAEAIKPYSRYPFYPDYCSTPEQIKLRAIPRLRDDVQAGDTRLVQVTTVIRHGSRTPLTQQCWDGYFTSADTAIWNCDLRTLIATPIPTEFARQGIDGNDSDGVEDIMIFEKVYNGLSYPNGTTGNVLNGTCQLGQLLNLGYDQQVLNGQLLRDAYLFDPGNDHTADLRLQLMSSTDFGPSSVYFRSDDDQRTLMSGQVLLMSMSDSMLQGDWNMAQLHLGDKERDVLSDNDDICPRIKQLADEADQSVEFKQFNSSKASEEIRKFMQTNFGRVLGHPLDCMMPAICNDLTIPESIDDFSINNTGGNFARVADFDVRHKMFAVRHNDAAMSKLSMGPLWYEILDKIQATTNHTSISESSDPIAKLTLVSAHDSTISQLMSSLGPKVWNASDWPPYASMMIVETHEIVGGSPNRSIFASDFAFRLLYNGRVLTTLIDGCDTHSDLCDWDVLKQRLRPFAIQKRSCEIVDTPTSQSSLHGITGTAQDIALVLAAMSTGFILGIIFTFRYLKTRMASNRRLKPLASAQSRSYSTIATSSSEICEG